MFDRNLLIRLLKKSPIINTVAVKLGEAIAVSLCTLTVNQYALSHKSMVMQSN